MIFRIAAMGMTLALAGCFTVGTGGKIDPEYVKTIKRCQTTEKELVEHLGTPTSDSMAGSHRQLFWTSTDPGFINPLNPKVASKNVNVIVNESGLVIGVGSEAAKDCAKAKTTH